MTEQQERLVREAMAVSLERLAKCLREGADVTQLDYRPEPETEYRDVERSMLDFVREEIAAEFEHCEDYRFAVERPGIAKSVPDHSGEGWDVYA